MSTVPSWLLRHQVSVQEYQGSGSLGDIFGPATPVRCLVVEKRRMVVNGQGEEVMSSSSYIAKPNHEPNEKSKVTLPSGRVALVVAVTKVTAPGLPTPDNTEVFLN